MAGSREQKFLIRLQAEYAGEKAIDALKSDLKSIDKIDAFHRQQKKLMELRDEFATTSSNVKNLRAALEKSFDPALEKKIGKAAAQVKQFSVQLGKQQEKLSQLAEKSSIAEKEYQSFAAAIKGSPTAKEAARLDKLQIALDKAGLRYKTQAARIESTSTKLAEAAQKREQLTAAWKKSSDPAILRQLKAAEKDLARQTQAVADQKEKVKETTAALKGMGHSLSGLKKEYAALHKHSESYGRDLAAMRTLGVRSFKEVKKEIDGLEQAFARLKASSDIGWREKIVYADRMRKKISVLQEETNGWKTRLGELRAGWAGVLGVIAGGAGFVNLAGNMAKSAKELKIHAELAGTNVEQFSAFAYAAKSVGIEQEKLADISKDVSDKLGDFIATGGGEMKDFFENVGSKVGLTAKSLQHLSGPEVLVAMKKAMDDAGISEKEQVFYLEAIANDASKLTPLLKNNAAALREKAAEARRLGLTISEMDNNKLIEQAEATLKMKESWAALGRDLVGILSPVLTATANGLREIAAQFRSLSPVTKDFILGAGVVATSLVAWYSGLNNIVHASKLAFVSMSGGITKVARAFASFSAQAAALAIANPWAVVITGLAVAALYAINEIRKVKAEVAAARENTDALRDKTVEKFRQIGKETGVAINSFKDWVRVTHDGTLQFDRDAGRWVNTLTGAQSQVVKGYKKVTAAAAASGEKQKVLTEEALNKMKSAYQQYADEVIAAQNRIAKRTASVTEEIRAMNREEMSDKQAWEDRKAEADEYHAKAKAARDAGLQALQAGDKALANLKFAEASEAVGKASTAYKSLHREVRDGDKVVKTSVETLKIAEKKMLEMKDLADSVDKAIVKSGFEAMEKLTEKANFADLSKGMDKAKLAWFDNWNKMSGKAAAEVEVVERKISALVNKERVVTIKVREVREKVSGESAPVQKKRWGGEIIRDLVSGSWIPGWGGGDRIPALVEAGEFVLRKEAVRAIGLSKLKQLNTLQVPRFRDGGLVGYTEEDDEEYKKRKRELEYAARKYAEAKQNRLDKERGTLFRTYRNHEETEKGEWLRALERKRFEKEYLEAKFREKRRKIALERRKKREAAAAEARKKDEAAIARVAQAAAEKQKKAQQEIAAAAKKAAAQRMAFAKKLAQVEQGNIARQKSLYQRYASAVHKLQDSIAGREKSLKQQLAELAGKKNNSWKSRLAAALNYQKQAQKALAQGRLFAARKFADQARAGFYQLKDAKEAGAKRARRMAYSGVKSAGELGIAIERQLARALQNKRVARPQSSTSEKKVVELKLGNARLSGSQGDVDSFIKQLEAARLLA